MDPILFALLTGVAGSALWEGTKKSLSFARVQNPLRRFYCFKGQGKIVVVQSAIKNQDRTEYYEYIATPDCVIGYHVLSTQLTQAKFPPSRAISRFAPLVGTEDMERDMISIGGYENNQISEKLNNFERPLYLKDNKIRVRGKDDLMWDIVLDDKGRIDRDYCLISRQRSPFQKDGRWVVAFEGVRHFGTEAGVRFIEPKNLRTGPLARVKPGTEVFVVVGCKVYHLANGGYHLANIQMEYIWYDGAGRTVRHHGSND